MQKEVHSIPLNLLKLDQENVRFGGDVAQNQREAIELMMADPDDAKKLLVLTNHIVEHGLDPTELQLAMPEPGETGSYIVLEGNRRLTALKLLQKPDLCPVESLLRRFIEIQKNLGDRLPTEIMCSIVQTREDGDVWIQLKHTGQNEGAGRLTWSGDVKDEYKSRQTGIESIGRQVRQLVKNNADQFSEKTLLGVFDVPVTTLTRLFSSRPAQDLFMLKVVNKRLEPQTETKNIAPSLEFAIALFTDHGYTVTDIHKNEDREAFVNRIPEEITPLALIVASLSEGLSELSNDDGNPNHHAPDSDDMGEPPPSADAADSATEAQPSNSHIKRTRARPSSRARKFLTPWSLSIDNTRINAIYRELRSELEVEKCPNATAIAFRVFLEVTCDDYMDKELAAGRQILRADNQNPLKDSDKLGLKIRSVAMHLKKNGKIDQHVAKTIEKRGNSKDTIGSVDHFNQYVHGTASMPIPSELKDIADEYHPFLEAIWS